MCTLKSQNIKQYESRIHNLTMYTGINCLSYIKYIILLCFRQQTICNEKYYTHPFNNNYLCHYMVINLVFGVLFIFSSLYCIKYNVMFIIFYKYIYTHTRVNIVHYVHYASKHLYDKSFTIQTLLLIILRDFSCTRCIMIFDSI